MRYQDSTSIANNVAEGGVVAVTVAVLQKTVLAMIPFALPALVLIALDFWFGIKASRHRYKKYKRPDDRVTFSKALRGTTGKVFEFAAWLILASSMSIAFEQEWIQWATLALVYVNEIGSIIGNYLCTKDIEFSLLGFLKSLIVFVGRWVAARIGIIADDVTFDGVFKPMPKGQPRNEKGQFTTKKRGRK